jgi:hypothetical protein
VSRSPHLFRDCAATTLAIPDPAHVGAVAAILGHTNSRTRCRHLAVVARRRIARSGDNLTGVSFLTHELIQKRLELIHELVPMAATTAFIVNPTNARTESDIAEVQQASRAKGIKIQVLRAATNAEIDGRFSALHAAH